MENNSSADVMNMDLLMSSWVNQTQDLRASLRCLHKADSKRVCGMCEQGEVTSDNERDAGGNNEGEMCPKGLECDK